MHLGCRGDVRPADYTTQQGTDCEIAVYRRSHGNLVCHGLTIFLKKRN